MTPAQSTLLKPLPAMLQRTMQLCWRSQGDGLSAKAQRRFVLQIELCSRDTAMIEAWVEHAARRIVALERQLLPITFCLQDYMLHIDVFSARDGATDPAASRIAAVSLMLGRESHDGTAATRPLYVQTSLLQQAGFTPGGYDAATLEWSAGPRAPR